jgi:hypothetical protein
MHITTDPPSRKRYVFKQLKATKFNPIPKRIPRFLSRPVMKLENQNGSELKKGHAAPPAA